MVPALIVRTVGSVLLVFGLVLAYLPILAVKRQLAVYGAFRAGAVVPMVCFWVISAFCLFVGCRLLFTRPNANKSILPPAGWMVLAILFYAISVASIAPVASGGDYRLLFVAVGFALLGYGCGRARRALRLGTTASQVFTPETSLLKLDGFRPAGFQCGIEILNDDRTPMEFVVSVLQANVGMNRQDAIKAMLEVHEKGGILLPMQSVEHSRQVAELIEKKACESSYPLVCRAVHVE